MSKLNEQKEITKLEKKLNDEALVGELRSLSKKELEFKLLELAKHAQEIETTKSMDEELQRTKDLLKELNAPYSEQLKTNKLKSRLYHLIIKEKDEV